jgi:hypothetical protein
MEMTMSNRQIEPLGEHQTAALSGTILALDLGTTTGWALQAADGLITSGTVSFRPGRYDGGGMRYLRFTNWLTEIDRLSGPIAAIWFEEVRRHAGTDAAHVFGGQRRAPEEVKRDGWREQGVLAVSVDDQRLTWPERELVEQLGEKLYGKRPEDHRYG